MRLADGKRKLKAEQDQNFLNSLRRSQVEVQMVRQGERDLCLILRPFLRLLIPSLNELTQISNW